VILGTAAFTDIDFLDDVLGAFRERVIVSVDTRGGNVSTSGWQQTTQMPADASSSAAAPRACARSSTRTSTATGCSRARPRRGRAGSRGVRGRFCTRAGSARSTTSAALAALRQVNLGGVIVGKRSTKGVSRSTRRSALVQG
jgi:phosphoribosylformimino-5-aminoimidazole carboxamide ribotide isomerase